MTNNTLYDNYMTNNTLYDNYMTNNTLYDNYMTNNTLYDKQHIDQFNSATFLCLFQTRTWISNVLYRGPFLCSVS